MAVLECLQDAGASETEQLSSACEHLVWEFKVIINYRLNIIRGRSWDHPGSRIPNPGPVSKYNHYLGQFDN
jgi:hypothetical protein